LTLCIYYDIIKQGGERVNRLEIIAVFESLKVLNNAKMHEEIDRIISKVLREAETKPEKEQKNKE